MRSLSCIPGCVRGDEESYITSNAMTGETVFDMARLRVASAGAAPGANASAAAMRHESAKAVLIVLPEAFPRKLKASAAAGCRFDCPHGAANLQAWTALPTPPDGWGWPMKPTPGAAGGADSVQGTGHLSSSAEARAGDGFPRPEDK